MRDRGVSLIKTTRRQKRGGLESTGLLTQDADPGGTTLVDARNGFKKMSRLAMLWTVRHR